MTLPRRFTLLAGLGCLAAAAHAQPVSELQTPREKISYAIGAQTARSFAKDGVDVDLGLVILGMKDAVAGERLRLSDIEMRQLIQGLLADMRQKMLAKRRDSAERNRVKGEEFLAANKARDGIQMLPGGVQYRVMREGGGPRPEDGDTVLCHYRGTLLDGTEFDASPPGRHAALKLAQAIPGWREVLKAMPVGSRWEVFIPPALAYGERGVGIDIGPNEVLTFDVELVGIQQPEKSADAQQSAELPAQPGSGQTEH